MILLNLCQQNTFTTRNLSIIIRASYQSGGPTCSCPLLCDNDVISCHRMLFDDCDSTKGVETVFILSDDDHLRLVGRTCMDIVGQGV